MTPLLRRGRRLAVLLITLVALFAALLSSCGGRKPVTGSASPWHPLAQRTRIQAVFGVTMAFQNERRGWLIKVMGRGVQETSDGGRSWRPCPGRIVGVPRQGLGALPARVAQLPVTQDVILAGSDLFVAYGGPHVPGTSNWGLRSGVLVSGDGGRTFRRCVFLPAMDSRVNALSAPDARHVWALCEGTAAMPTTAALPSAAGSAPAPVPGNSNKAVRTDQSLLESDDGGATWRTVWHGHGNDGAGLLDAPLQFVDARQGWASSDGGLLFTSDGGVTWDRRGINGFAVAVGATHLWDVWGTSGDDPADVDGGLEWSSDGGHSWHEVGGFRGVDMSGDIYFSDALHGWVEGPGARDGYVAIWASSDGGHSWHSELDFRLRSAYQFTFARAGTMLIFSSGAQTFVRQLPATQ